MRLFRRHDQENFLTRTHLTLSSANQESASFYRGFCCLLTIICAFACSAPPKNLIKPGPAIPGMNLSGGYDCLQFGYMRLRHTGKTVRGTYEGLRKNGDNGTITGTIEGDIVWVEWVQPGNIEEAILPKRGKGWWRVSERGARLEGQWGYDDSKDDGGRWVADRSEFSD